MSEQKTHWKKAFNSPYLGSWDLPDYEDIKLTIKEVSIKMSKGLAENSKFNIATFVEKGYKPMLLNATNCKALVKLTDSPNIEDWVNVPVTLYVEKVKAFGEIHDALRIRAEKETIKPDLKQGSQSWEKCVAYLKKNPTKIKVITDKYNLSATLKKQLQDESKKN